MSVFFAHGAFDITLCGLFRLDIAFIVKLFALAEPQLDFDILAEKIHRKRYERITLLPDGAEEPVDLAPVHEQLARAVGIAVEDIALFVRADVYAVGDKLAVFDTAEGILQIHPSAADGFDLCPAKSGAGFEAVDDEIFVIRGFILCDYLLFRHTAPPFLFDPCG